jgi:thiamine pyrophosphate-dependent acetolactate synthase large subunit-like protein
VAEGSGTVGDLLAGCLYAAGVRRIFGQPIPGLAHLPVIPVEDPTLASLLADADGRTGRLGAAWLPGQRLRIGAAPGLVVEPVRVDAPDQLPSAVARMARPDIPESGELVLPLGLDWPVPGDAFPLVPADPPADLALALAKAREDPARVTVLAGPGVVRTGHVESLRRLAEVTGWGVLNSWGAKGVFAWDDPHHLGTAGLQEQDFALAGFAERFVILTGGDPRESPRARWRLGDSAEVHPRFLGDLADCWDVPTLVQPPDRSGLFQIMADLVGPRYTDDAAPWNPARAAFELAQTRPEGGLVAADPGPAGFWVARAFPTTEQNSVIVPATRVRGFAAAAAIVAALDGRPAVAVTTGPLDDLSTALLDLAVGLELPLTLQVWGDVDAGERAWGGQVRTIGLPVDFSLTEDLVAAAGPIVAWQ